ncbi:MAG: N-acetyltransferase family protein [Ilumatobacter sp.]
MSEVTSAMVTIRRTHHRDAAAMRAIYNHEVENFTSTLDIVARSLEEQQSWIEQRSGAFAAISAVLHDGTDDEVLVGFASLSKFKDRAAYSPTVENSVYVSRSHAGLGIGRLLMNRLIDDARDSGFHSMIARIEASGDASRALHRACGFELVGVEKQVGRKFGRWLDMAVMQLML